MHALVEIRLTGAGNPSCSHVAHNPEKCLSLQSNGAPSSNQQATPSSVFMAAGADSPSRAALQAAVLEQGESLGVEGGPKRAKLTGTKPAAVRASDNHVSHWQLECMTPKTCLDMAGCTQMLVFSSV